jgi:hypothetical protein
MANNNSAVTTRKITVTLPQTVLERLDEMVPSRQRSHFIALAVQEQLALLEQGVALEETAAAWTGENHPEMLTEADIDRWLADLRSGWARE